MERLLATQHIANVNAYIAAPIGDDPYLTRDSIAFHTRLGYRKVGEFDRCAYKFGRWYSMVWMEKHIGAHLTPQPEVIPFPDLQYDHVRFVPDPANSSKAWNVGKQ